MSHLRSALLVAVGAITGAFLPVASLWPPASQAVAVDQRLASRIDPAALPNPLVSGSRHLARVAATAMPAVVHIVSTRVLEGREVEETGSGALMHSPVGEGVVVVTNHHVVANAEPQHILVKLSDGRILSPVAKAEDSKTDLAVLRMSERDLPTIEWGDSGALEIGHMVLAMGSPFGLDQSVTYGIVSAKGRRSLQLGAGREVLNQDFLQTDAAINPGNSGGPLVDLSGRLVGVNTAIASNSGGSEGIGFSVPSNLARKIVTELLTHGEVRRGYLGVRLDEQFDMSAARRYGLRRHRGARVIEVYPNTPAARGGLRMHDIILTFDGLEIEDENHLIHIVSMTELGKSVRLIVQRGSQQVALRVTLTEARPQ